MNFLRAEHKLCDIKPLLRVDPDDGTSESWLGMLALFLAKRSGQTLADFIADMNHLTFSFQRCIQAAAVMPDWLKEQP